jgi:CHAT domain-containing protein
LVEVLWTGRWWSAKLERIQGERYCISYEGYERSWDECVTSERIRRTNTTEPRAEAERLRQQADQHFQYDRRYDSAIQVYQQALEIYRAIGDRNGEAGILSSLASTYYGQGQVEKVSETYQQALKIYREIEDRHKELSILGALWSFYGSIQDLPEAIYYVQQYLKLFQELHPSYTRSHILRYLHEYYLVQANYAKSIEVAQDWLSSAQQAQSTHDERWALAALVKTYTAMGDEAKAAEYQSRLEPRQQSYIAESDRDTLAKIESYRQQFAEAPQQHLSIRFVQLLHEAGDIYMRLGNKTQALELYEQSFVLRSRFDDDALKSIRFMNDSIDRSLADKLTELYIESGNYQKAIETALATLTWRRQYAMDYLFERSALQYLGIAYQRSGNSAKATEIYEQLLAQSQLNGDRSSHIDALNGLASLKSEQNNTELAIVFYKQAVNEIETVRQDLRQLPKQQQEAYTRKVEDIYRRLADLLLAQGRILEAQQALELLKIQEIRNYTRNASAGEQTSGVATNPVETQVLQTHGTLIAFGQKVADCEQSKCNQLSQLLDQREALSTEFNRAVEALEQTIRDNRRDDRIFTDPTQLFGNPDRIVSAQPGTILLQTLVLPDRLWVLWASKGGVTKSIAVPIGQKQLSETVLKFRQLLQNPTSDIQELQATGKQLYDWLIPKELQAEFAANSIQHFVFSLDHVTRYIPMAALFDGKQYLTQRYTLSTITSTNTQMGNSELLGVQNTSVLALGLSEAKAEFNPLPNVPVELDAIVRQSESDSQGIYPGSEYLNSAFDWRTLRDNLSTHNILHIATHGKFEPGNADASFLLMGDGEKLPIPKIETLKNLSNLQLVALSACETALGGTGQDGTEISGISYYFLNNGAKAVMASLWAVNDGSTSLLMQQFYKNLATSQQPITKAEALRQAQLSLLNKQVTAKDAPQRADADVALDPKPGAQLPRRSAPDFSHPYYWAPFILIGNSL